MSIITIRNRQPAQLFIIIIGLALLYAVTGRLSFFMAPVGDVATPSLFLPAALALVAALRFGRGVWPGILLGQILLSAFTQITLPAAIAIGVINSVEIVLAVTLFHRLRCNPALTTIRDLALLIGMITFVLQPFNATLSMWALDYLNNGLLLPKSTFWIQWWFGNVLAQIIVVPLLLSLTYQHKNDNWNKKELLPLAVLLTIVCWLTLMVLTPFSVAMPFAVFTPLLVIIAIRYGVGPGSVATFLVATMTMLAEIIGVSSTDTQAPVLSTLDLNIFLLGIVPAVQAIAILSRQQLNTARTLTKLERQYRHLFEQAPILVNAFNDENRCVIWNAECAKLFNRTNEEMLQHPDPLSLLYPDPDVRIQILKNRKDPMSGSVFTEWHPQHRDGTRLTTLWASVPMQDGVIFNIGVNITERKQTESRLQVAASVFEHSYDGIVIISPDRTIIDINPAGARMVGYEQAELRNQPLSAYRSKGSPEAFYTAIWDSLDLNGSWQGEVVLDHPVTQLQTLDSTMIKVSDADNQVLRYILVFTDTTNIKAKEAELQRMAHFDSLTRLPNRYLLNDRLQQGIINARRHKHSMAVCYMDLDGFKHINDTQGHDAGDAVLTEIAQRVQVALRANDTVARLGGDEFALLLTNLADHADCHDVLNRVLLSVAEPIALDNGIGKVTASIGISFFSHDGATFDVLLSKADTAMYHAKHSGKNRYCFYSSLDHSITVTPGQT